jgi:hypothetical protein
MYWIGVSQGIRKSFQEQYDSSLAYDQTIGSVIKWPRIVAA